MRKIRSDDTARALVSQILRHNYYFGADRISWEKEKRGRSGKRRISRSPTPAEDSSRAKKAMELLWKCDSDSAKDLGDRLDKCAAAHRCRSGACPRCASAFQRWFVEEMLEFIEREKIVEDRLVAISIVPCDGFLRAGRLANLSLRSLKRRIKRCLKGFNLAWAIGGVDLSLNEAASGSKPVWVPHLYLIGETSNKKQLRKELKRKFGSSRRVPRPVVVNSFTPDAYGVSYVFKTTYVRRVSYVHPNGRKHTKHEKLRIRDRKELLVCLDTWGFADRTFFWRATPRIADFGTSIEKIQTVPEKRNGRNRGTRRKPARTNP